MIPVRVHKRSQKLLKMVNVSASAHPVIVSWNGRDESILVWTNEGMCKNIFILYGSFLYESVVYKIQIVYILAWQVQKQKLVQ